MVVFVCKDGIVDSTCGVFFLLWREDSIAPENGRSVHKHGGFHSRKLLAYEQRSGSRLRIV